LVLFVVVKTHGNVKAKSIEHGPYGFRIYCCCINVGLDGTHAATDINANGFGNYGIHTGYYPANGHAEPFMAVRHQGNMLENKGQRRKITGLCHGAAFNMSAPRFNGNFIFGLY
jgi:hypothetical protein